ncbi:MAG: hypothetical protein AB1656_25160 [Candidatus Omnitrophota bacterium]
MGPQILSNIKGSEIPASWREKITTDPDQFYTIVIRSQDNANDDDEDYPEGKLTEEIIEAIERSSAEYKEGKGTLCRNEEELEAFFKGIIEDD